MDIFLIGTFNTGSGRTVVFGLSVKGEYIMKKKERCQLSKIFIFYIGRNWIRVFVSVYT